MHIRHWSTGVGAAVAALTLAGSPRLAAAQDHPLVIPHVTGDVTLDGRFDEPAWARAVTLPLVGYIPTAGAAPSESTFVRVMHDGAAIYVAAELYDREPAGVQAWSRGRDDDQGGDFINVLLDAYGDRENATVFSTTPVGARLDYAISNDAEGPSPASIAWNGFWDVRVRRDRTGWFAEFRIPFSTLRYQASGDEVRMGLIVNRLIGRRNERVIFPAIEPRWSFGMFKPSRAQAVAFRHVVRARQGVAVPYVVTGGERGGRAGFDARGVPMRDARVDAGADLKVALSHNVNLDATVNTDFAESEVDDQRIDLGRFPIADPERRQFFLERAGIFDFTFAGDNRLLATRRIGLTAGGERVPLYGGARLVSRMRGADIGLLTMQARATAGEPATNFGVLRLRSRVLNDESYVGGMATSRIRPDDRHGAVGGDAALRVGGPYFVRLAAALADTMPAAAPAARSRDRLGWTAQVERRSTIGLGGSLGMLSLGTAFAPPVGFVETSGLRRMEARATYGLEIPAGRALRLVTPGLRMMRGHDLEADALQSVLIAGDATAEWRSGAVATVGIERRREITREDLHFADRFIVPPGDYAFTTLTASAGSPPSGLGNVTARLSAGGFFGGRRTTGMLSAVWHPVPPVSATVDYVHERLVLDSSRTTLQVVRLRATASPSAAQSGAVTAQLSTAARLARINARWRVNFREATDLWIVYDHALDTERDPMTPPVTRTAAQTFLVKLTYALAN
jgi:hypothetical protein